VTTDGSKQYTVQDELDFGEPIPVLYPRLGLRFTLPAIMHGSTPSADQDRYVIYDCCTRINPNDELELKGQHSYSEIIACPILMQAPTKGANGDNVTKDRPLYRFPTNLAMKSSTALADAQIGRRTYEDWNVLKELHILFGPDDEKAREYVRDARCKLIQNAFDGWKDLPEAEIATYRSNSFFAI
jgi:hypothetical protein